MRLNDQWRLILEITEGESGPVAKIIEITDHYK
jgi:plasmid maintenance system killer protein